MSLMERYGQQAVLLDRTRLRRQRVIGHFVHPDIEELMGMEAKEWTVRDRRLRSSGVPMAALGFAAPLLPNVEPVVAPGSISATAETNLYSLSGTGTNWNSIPAGSLRAPQAIRVVACGVISNNSTGTEKFTTRIGTSSTATNNVSLGATGAITLGSAIATALWWYEAHATVLTAGTAGTMTSHAQIGISQQAAGSATSSNTAYSGNTTGTVDMTLQQAWSLGVTGGNTGSTCQLTQFLIAAWD